MVKSVWVNQTGSLFPQGATIYQVVVTPKGVAAASVTLHFGSDDAGLPIGIFRSRADQSQVVPLLGMKVPDGLFVSIDANTEGVLILWNVIAHPDETSSN